MADWRVVASGGLWVLGLAVVLGAFSYHYWLVRETGRPARDLWCSPSLRSWCAAGLGLACVGFGLSPGAAWWERVAWLVVVGGIAAGAWRKASPGA